MPRTVQRHHDQVLHLAIEAPSHGLQVVSHRSVEIHRPFRTGTHDELLHVDVGRMKKTAALGRRQNGKGVRGAGGAQIGPLQRVNGNVYLR